MNCCPYCNSKDIDWSIHSDGIPGESMIETALCLECGKTWEIVYVFEYYVKMEEETAVVSRD